MTIVYRLAPDNDHFHNFALRDEAGSEVFRAFNGTAIGSSWVPLDITAADTDDELAQLADHALLGAIPILSERAVDALGSLVTRCGELLPVDYDRQKYFAYNVTNIIDCLDESRSSVTRFQSGRVMSIERFAFRPSAIVGGSIFKIPELTKAFVFATQPFKEAVQKADLTGFAFREVWRDA